MDELKNINKLFRIFDSINEAYNEINDILSNKKIIIKRGLNELNLYLSLSRISSKSEDISLKIKKEDFNNQIVNDIIIKELNEIKKLLMEEKQKNKQLNNIVDELIQEKNQLKIKVEELIKWKESITKQEIKELVNKYKIDSKIITKNEEVELLSNRLTSKGFIKNQKVIFNLVYRSFRDGSHPNNFHSKCDGKMNTICIIQTIK